MDATNPILLDLIEDPIMARNKVTLLLATFITLAMTLPTMGQFQNPQAERPIINGFRQLTTNNLFTDAAQRFSQNSPLSGRLCPKCATKRNQRFKELAEDRQFLRDSQKFSLEKLKEEAKKAKFEAKALEEADYEKHKPWDVAAPENAESGSPLLEAAQATKQDQDMAPKKIRALEYIAQLGCNKDPKVEAAILAGLKDHNPAVRWAAIQAVIASARGPAPYVQNPFGDAIVPAQPVNTMIDPIKFGLEEVGYPPKEPGGEKKEGEGDAAAAQAPQCQPCENGAKRKPLQRIKGLCKKCKGHGCRGCNYCGHEAVPCEVCPPIVEAPCQECLACKVHDGCISCCPSKAILAELKKIATESDPDRPGCYFEPSLDVRNLALEALNVCPPIVKKNQNGGGGFEEGKGQKKDDNNVTEGDDSSSPSDVPSEEKNGDDSSIDLSPPSSDDVTAGRINSFVPVSHRRTANYTNEDQSELLMNARIAKFYPNGFLIEFGEDYHIPVGRQLLVQLTDGRTHIVNIIKSEVGYAQVSPIEGKLFNIPSTQLSVGVIQ